jgi:hypothetical protein
MTTEAPWANGKSYGIGEERSLCLSLLQALAVMWSFSMCRFLKGDTSSLWYELGVEDANKKAPNACLFLHFSWVEVAIA